LLLVLVVGFRCSLFAVAVLATVAVVVVSGGGGGGGGGGRGGGIPLSL